MTTAAIILVPPPDEFDATREISGLTPVYRLILTFRLAGIRRVVVAGGEYLRPIVRYFPRSGAEFAIARKSVSAGAGLAAALRFLGGKCDRALIIPAQFPFIETETARKLAASEIGVEAPLHDGVRGWPLAVSAGYFERLIALEGDVEHLLAECPAVLTGVDDAGTATGVSGETDSEAMLARHSLRKTPRPIVKVSIAHDRSFFGPGVAQLLRLMEETRSLKTAGAIMGVAFSYALKLAGGIEENLGFRAYRHEPKGRAGGYSFLTDECRDFLARYEAFAADCERYAQENFHRYFDGTGKP